jgi:flagellar hook-length control protein FliK
MKSVKALLVTDKNEDDQTNGNTDPKTGNRDKRISLMGLQTPKGSFKVVAEHAKKFLDKDSTTIKMPVYQAADRQLLTPKSTSPTVRFRYAPCPVNTRSSAP